MIQSEESPNHSLSITNWTMPGMNVAPSGKILSWWAEGDLRWETKRENMIMKFTETHHLQRIVLPTYDIGSQLPPAWHNILNAIVNPAQM